MSLCARVGTTSVAYAARGRWSARPRPAGQARLRPTEAGTCALLVLGAD